MLKEKKNMLSVSLHFICMYISTKISVLIRIILYFINLIGRQYKNEQRTRVFQYVLPEVKLELNHFSYNLFLYNKSITLEYVIKLSKYSSYFYKKYLCDYFHITHAEGYSRA